MKRFWDKVNKTDDCWIWTAAIDDGGYGHFWLNNKIEKAHRVSWIIHNGPIQDDKLRVCHKCDNPPCVRPDHLFLGTDKDNSRDCIDKGRRLHLIGENATNVKLTDQEVEKIRNMYLTKQYTQRELGSLFGVSQSQIYMIVNNKSR